MQNAVVSPLALSLSVKTGKPLNRSNIGVARKRLCEAAGVKGVTA